MPNKQKSEDRSRKTENLSSVFCYLSSGFVLIEMVVVIFLLGLFVAMAMVNVASILGKNTFKAQVHGLVMSFQMAAAKASESSRRYEIVVDPQMNSYLFREISVPDLAADILQEEVIREHYFGDGVRIKYVQFDDGTVTTDQAAKFRAGRAGWQYGGKVAILDEDGNEYTIMIPRLGGTAELLDGVVDILETKADLAF